MMFALAITFLAAAMAATDITVDNDKALNYAVDWGIGVNPGDGSLDQSVTDANWCDASYPNQSPINVQDKFMNVIYDTKQLDFVPHTVPSTNMVLTSNGVELELEGEWLTLKHFGQTYKASQLHFHSPSEHVFNGMHCAGEMHVVCNNEDGTLADGKGPHGHAVLAFCLEMGIEVNPFFAKIDKLMASQSATAIVPGYKSPDLLGWDFNSFVPYMAGDYAYYLGSYTTPACNPNIDWFMIQKPVQVSVAMIEFMQRRFEQPANHRPLQAMTGRMLDFHHVCDCTDIKEPRRTWRLLFASGGDLKEDLSGCRKACA